MANDLHLYLPIGRDDRYIGTIRVTKPKWIREAEGFDDVGVYVMYAKVPARLGLSFEDIQASIYNQPTTRCMHDYDCCGCRFEFWSVRKTGRRTIRFKVTVGRNY